MSIHLFLILTEQVEDLLSVLLSATCAASEASDTNHSYGSFKTVIDSLYKNIAFAVRASIYWYVVFLVLNGDIVNVLCLKFAFYGDETYGDL